MWCTDATMLASVEPFVTLFLGLNRHRALLFNRDAVSALFLHMLCWFFHDYVCVLLLVSLEIMHLGYLFHENCSLPFLCC